MTVDEHDTQLEKQQSVTNAAIQIRNGVLTCKNVTITPAFETIKDVLNLPAAFDFAKTTIAQVKTVFPDIDDALAERYRQIFVRGWKAKNAIETEIGNADDLE